MKKRLLCLLLVAPLCVLAIGCGKSGSGAVTDNADQSAIEAYKAAVAADDARMSSEAPPDVKPPK